MPNRLGLWLELTESWSVSVAFDGRFPKFVLPSFSNPLPDCVYIVTFSFSGMIIRRVTENGDVEGKIPACLAREVG